MEPMGRTRSVTTTLASGCCALIFIARLAQMDDVPVPPLALRKTINNPFSFSLGVTSGTVAGVPALKRFWRVFSSTGTAWEDFNMYSVTPAFRQVSLSAELESLESAIRGVLFVRGSFCNL